MMNSANPHLTPADISSPSRELVAMLRPYLIGFAVIVMIVALAPLQWLAVRYGWPLQRYIPVVFHRITCALIGVRIHLRGQRDRHKPLLIVSNHVSWLDICVVSAVAPVVFVAKQEVGTWPVISLLARLQRTVFIDRTRKMHTGSVTGTMAAHMNNGDAVVLFAEGTSTDGNRVLPFRSALIGAVQQAIAQSAHVETVTVQPLSIAYTHLAGLPLGRALRSRVAWYGATDLLPHLRDVLAMGDIDVTLTWGEPEICDQNSDRKEIARRTENTVRRLTVRALRG